MFGSHKKIRTFKADMSIEINGMMESTNEQPWPAVFFLPLGVSAPQSEKCWSKRRSF
jgi:hypothetical protein